VAVRGRVAGSGAVDQRTALHPFGLCASVAYLQFSRLGHAVTAFDRYADKYEEKLDEATGGVGDPRLFAEIKASAIVRVATRFLGSPAAVSALDVGCGTGLTDSFLRETFASIAGVDVSPKMVEQARNANPGVDYEVYDGGRLPFDSASFDIAFAISVLHHVEPADWRAFAEEIARVVRPGGLVVVVEHNPLNPLTRLVVSRCEFDEDVRLVRMQETKRLLAGAGVDVLESRYIVFFPWHARMLRDAESVLGFLPLGAQYLVAARRG
jgi:SAM-dependent methyltransferase